MQKIAQFFKVSYKQFEDSWKDTFGEADGVSNIYEEIKLPVRATTGSAGYDFYTPFTFHLKPGETIKIPTGIRVKMEDNCSSVREWNASRESANPRSQKYFATSSANKPLCFPFSK